LEVQKVQAVTGHKSTRMTEWYTHFDPLEFGGVPQIQADLLRPQDNDLAGKRSGNGAAGRPALTLVKPQEEKSPARRKRA
jgi:hypothetical protein